jgi:processive 1,2-diacylglycerol beta-glucosyltransferase
MFDRVLILSVSAGAGHLRAAQAVENAFVQLGASRQIRNVDTLQYTNKLFRNLYHDADTEELIHKLEERLKNHGVESNEKIPQSTPIRI